MKLRSIGGAASGENIAVCKGSDVVTGTRVFGVSARSLAVDSASAINVSALLVANPEFLSWFRSLEDNVTVISVPSGLEVELVVNVIPSVSLEPLKMVIPLTSNPTEDTGSEKVRVRLPPSMLRVKFRSIGFTVSKMNSSTSRPVVNGVMGLPAMSVKADDAIVM